MFHWLGGFASASNFIPFRGIKRWSWEIYWIIQGGAAWLITPLLLAGLLVPDLFQILRIAPPSSIGFALLWGCMWGVGGLTFGLAIRYLGLGLGYAIALGFCTAFGTLIPPLWHRQMGTIIHERSGQMILLGVCICLCAIVISGAAGYSKESEISEEVKAEAGERDFSFVRGLSVAVFAGIMSSFFAVGLDAGKPIAEIARTRLVNEGRADLWQNLPVLVVVLWGGFATNFIWSSILIIRNHSVAQFFGRPGSNPLGTTHTTGHTLVGVDPRTRTQRVASGVLLRNYLLAALAGVIWYLQFFFYSIGQTRMGKYEFSSWTLHMASIIIFATLWGIVLSEWKRTSLRTRLLVTFGLFLLVASTVVVGYGSYLKSN